MAADRPGDPTQERSDNPTPNGGAYSIAFFLDDDGEPTSKADSTQWLIVEYDEEDKPVHRTYMKKRDRAGSEEREAPG